MRLQFLKVLAGDDQKYINDSILLGRNRHVRHQTKQFYFCQALGYPRDRVTYLDRR